MKTKNMWIATGLLLMISGLAIFGGLSLIVITDGTSLEVSPSWLRHTSFTNYLFLGWVVFLALGIGCLVPIVFMALQTDYCGHVVRIQGWIIMGWTVFNYLILQNLLPLHLFFFSVAIWTIILGRVIQNPKF
jgi:hypothetical protein